MNETPAALTIAGSDNSAGAGLQADLKTFGSLGVYGLTAVTCVVAEVPGKVSRIQPVAPEIVAEQVRLSFEAFPVSAVKTGMLFSREIIEAVCDALEGREIFLTVDPVMIASSGDALLEPDAVAAYEERLLPMADLITPNLDEAAALLGRKIPDLAAMREVAAELHARYGAGTLLKGGHLRGEWAVDVFVWNGETLELSAPFVPGVETHGTGCTYSAAVTAGVARGLDVVDAVKQAKDFVTEAIKTHLRWQRGESVTHALNHLSLGDR